MRYLLSRFQFIIQLSAITLVTVFVLAAFTHYAQAVAPPPPNDECADSIEVFDGVNPFDNFSATPPSPPSTPPFSCTSASKDVWFDYLATCTGAVQLSLCDNTNFDTVMEIFDTDSCNNLEGNSAKCNDDSCGLQSEITQNVLEGNRYLIRIGSYSDESAGLGDLEITCISSARSIPTLSEWGLIAMAGVLGLIGLMAIRRRKVTA